MRSACRTPEAGGRAPLRRLLAIPPLPRFRPDGRRGAWVCGASVAASAAGGMRLVGGRRRLSPRITTRRHRVDRDTIWRQFQRQLREEVLAGQGFHRRLGRRGRRKGRDARAPHMLTEAADGDDSSGPCNEEFLRSGGSWPIAAVAISKKLRVMASCALFGEVIAVAYLSLTALCAERIPHWRS